VTCLNEWQFAFYLRTKEEQEAKQDISDGPPFASLTKRTSTRDRVAGF
jgi:hypothetical protein